MGILLSKLVPKSIRGRAHALLTRTLPSRWYWRFRYWYGWGSGPGSRGELAKFKADFLNDFVERNGVASVVEFGCGDGEQLALLNYPRYVGFDVSRVAIKRCQRRFSSDSTKRFSTALTPISADLAISLDVIFHLVEQ